LLKVSLLLSLSFSFLRHDTLVKVHHFRARAGRVSLVSVHDAWDVYHVYLRHGISVYRTFSPD